MNWNATNEILRKVGGGATKGALWLMSRTPLCVDTLAETLFRKYSSEKGQRPAWRELGDAGKRSWRQDAKEVIEEIAKMVSF